MEIRSLNIVLLLLISGTCTDNYHLSGRFNVLVFLRTGTEYLIVQITGLYK